MKRPSSATLKNRTVRLSDSHLKHLKKRAKEQKHYKESEVVRRLIDADMAQPSN